MSRNKRRSIRDSDRILLLVALVLASGLLGATPVAADANPPAVQLFYVTLPETDALTVLSTINSAAVNPTYTYFSIAIGVDGTYVYYDQWENGYAADIAHPSTAEKYSASNPAGVQIWGNGLASDGCAPNIRGVPLTCTDANDVLRVGDVIIPYNAVPVPRVPVSQRYVLDTFTTQSYSRNDGNANWAGNWVEVGDDNSASGGTIYINSTSQHLRFRENTTTNDSIYRAVDLSTGGACATLSFTLGQNSIDSGEDRLRVEISSDGGVSYATLDTYISSSATGAKSYAIGAYASANTRVRFRALDTLEIGSEDGEYWSIDDVRIDWDCRVPVLFDAKDKIGASSSIAMARTVWASGSDTLNAFAHEMYATAEWGTRYETPVGVNTPYPAQGYSDQGMFEYAGLSIMAGQNNTTVWVDTNGDGNPDVTQELQEGGSFLQAAIPQGAVVTSSKPVQVLLVTGDIGSNYESRDMNLLPVSAYGTSYWAPVGVNTDNSFSGNTGPTRLFLYNPRGNTSMAFTCVTRAGSTTSGSVNPGNVWTFDLADNQAAHCTASQPFFGISTIDTPVSGVSTGQAWDWSYTLYPDSFLTTDALVGLGLGRDPNSPTNPTENGSPLWVTPVCDTYVYVDWNNDGVPDLVDLNGDGDTSDTVDSISEATSNRGMWITALKSARLFNPAVTSEPYDQSGARVWSRTSAWAGPGNPLPSEPGCRLAVAWGQDPRRATAAAPGLDVGTSVPPLRLVEGAKTLTFAPNGDTAPVDVLNPGDTVYYNITIKNTGAAEVTNVYVYDQVPEYTTYVPGTTEWRSDSTSWASIPDDGSGDGFPLDTTSGVLLGNLPAGATFYVRFQVVLQMGDHEDITNCFTAFTDAGASSRCVTRPVATKDWGDLPDSYGTAAAQNGPRHSWSGLKLGALWDVETQGQASDAADGDDLATSDDEDGVVNAASGDLWYAGNGSLNVSVAGGPGCLNAWMDFTGDAGTSLTPDGNFLKSGGGYDTYTVEGAYSEHIIQNMLLGNGMHSISLNGVVPPGVNPGAETSFYFRFRLSPPNAQGGCTDVVTPLGFVSGGEVEDHLFNLGLRSGSLGDLVWFDANVNGIQDEGEIGLSGILVKLNGPGGLYQEQSTDGNGNYLFTNLPAGEYTVQFVAPVHPVEGCYWLFAPQSQGSDPAVDSNANADGLAQPSPITLGPGEVNLTIDAGLRVWCPTPSNVELSEFAVTREGDMLRFKWCTASEFDTVGFGIYALQPESETLLWITESTIPPKGLGADPQDYYLEVERPDLEMGAMFYLRAYDTKGEYDDYGPVEAIYMAGIPRPDPDPEPTPQFRFSFWMPVVGR